MKRRALFQVVTLIVIWGGGLGAGFGFEAGLSFGGTARADYLDKNGIIKRPSGNVRLMSHQEALQACPAGTHLPTAREFATESVSLGSHGILELKDLKRGERPPEWYYLVEAQEPDGMRDIFYFNNRGYYNGKLPDSDLVKYDFWSSSFSPSQIWDFAYYVVGNRAALQFGPRDDKYHQLAVRCIR